MSQAPPQMLSALVAQVAEVEKQYERFHSQGIKKASIDLRQALMEITRVAKDLRKATIELRKAMPVASKPVDIPRSSDARPELVATKPRRVRKPRVKPPPSVPLGMVSA